MRDAGISEETIQARIGTQMAQSQQAMEKAQARMDDLRQNVRENKKGKVDEERNIRSDIRKDQIADQDRWQAAGVDLAKKAHDREPKQVMRADGSMMTVLDNGLGGFTDLTGKPIQLRPDDRMVSATAQGGMSDIGMTNAVKTDIQTNIVQAREQIANVTGMIDKLDPEFLTYKGRTKAWALDKAEQMGKTLSPDQAEFVTNFDAFARRAQDGLNQYINKITGAAIGKDEEPRLRAAMPNIEDGPTKFMASARDLIEYSRGVEGRMQLFTAMGKTPEQVMTEMSKSSGDTGNPHTPFGIPLETGTRFMQRKQELAERVIKARKEGRPLSLIHI